MLMTHRAPHPAKVLWKAGDGAREKPGVVMMQIFAPAISQRLSLMLPNASCRPWSFPYQIVVTMSEPQELRRCSSNLEYLHHMQLTLGELYVSAFPESPCLGSISLRYMQIIPNALLNTRLKSLFLQNRAMLKPANVFVSLLSPCLFRFASLAVEKLLQAA